MTTTSLKRPQEYPIPARQKESNRDCEPDSNMADCVGGRLREEGKRMCGGQAEWRSHTPAGVQTDGVTTS